MLRRRLAPAAAVALAVPVVVPLIALGAPAAPPPPVQVSSVLTSPAGALPTGPRANGTAVLPDGRLVTPVGRTVQVDLEPQNGVLSHDGRRLYVSSEGIDDDPPAGTDHDHTAHARFFSIIDTRTLKVTRVRDDALHSGLAESKDGRTIYVAEGQTDSLGVFRRTPGPEGSVGVVRKIADYRLNPTKPTDYPWGLALSPDGTRAYVTGFSGDSLITVALSDGRVLSRVPTGAYPYGVVASSDGRHVYVSNWGEYNTDASVRSGLPLSVPPVTYGGYNTINSDSVWTYDVMGVTPLLTDATRIGADLNGASVDGGSSPSGMALSPDDRTLAVTSSNDDVVELLDVTRDVLSSAAPSPAAPPVPEHPARTVDLRALVGTPRLPAPTGSQPNALAWTPDGAVLFAAEGERNDVAVIDPAKVRSGATNAVLAEEIADHPGTLAGPNRDAVVGRIPTAWYPSALAVSPHGDHLYVTSMRGLGAGANSNIGSAPANSVSPPAAAYIPNMIKGRVSDIALASACTELPRLSQVSDADNGLVPTSDQVASPGDGYVVPTAFGQPASSKIKHVFLIIKENRPFDQVLGDLPGVEADGNLASYGRFITPNTHALAQAFSVSDNYYATAETSTQGHYSVDTGQVNEFVDKVTPSSYAGKLPDGAFDTTPENEPQGGFIWNNAARHGVRTTVFGEATAVVGIAPGLLGLIGTKNPAGELVPGVQKNALTFFDPLYPTQVNVAGTFSPVAPAGKVVLPYNDEGRASAFADQLAAAQNNAPPRLVGGVLTAAAIGQLNVMILFDDHTSGDIAGAQTPERQIAENDHALGRVIDTITHSSYWDSSAVFVTEDDTQSGRDHVDAYRTFGLVISPYAKRGYVSHVHTSFSSMNKTIDLLLGLPPTSLQELTATSMADSFISKGAPDTAPYSTLANNTQPDTNQPLAQAKNALLRKAAQVALQLPHGIDEGASLYRYDSELERAGLLQEHDPNVKPTHNVVVHTLAQGSPAAVTLGQPPAVAGPADALCLHAAPASAPTLVRATGGTRPTAPHGGLAATGLSERLALTALGLVVAAAIAWRRRVHAIRER